MSKSLLALLLLLPFSDYNIAFADLHQLAKLSKKIDKKEYRLARGLYIVHLHVTAKLPVKNVAEEVGCSPATVRNVLKSQQDYKIDGPLYHQCMETGSKVGFLLHLIR